MSILKLFGKGFQTASKKSRLLVYLWLVNILFALIIIVPFYFLVQGDFENSFSGESLSTFSPLWLGDIIYKYQNVFPAVVGGLLIPGLLFVLLYVFLNGGIIGRIAAAEEKINLAGFFSDCGKYFWRFVRVSLMSLVGYVVVLGILMKIVSIPFEAWIKNASGDWSNIIAQNLKFLITILLLSVVQMFFDYVRISLVLEASTKTLRASSSTLSFLAGRFFKAWPLYLLVDVFLAAGSILLWVLGNQIPKGIGGLVVLFFWIQIVIVFRLWVKLVFFTTEYHFYRAHKF